MIEKADLSDNAINQIVELVKPILKEKDKEIERLNNIIDEIEKYIGVKMNSFGICNAGDIYWKLQELKGSE